MNKVPDWLRLPLAIAVMLAVAFLLVVLPPSIGKTILGLAFVLVLVAVFGRRFILVCLFVPVAAFAVFVVSVVFKHS